MSGVQEHYESLLGGVYTWLFGGFEPRIEENLRFFETLGIAPKGSGTALDLGCGSGFQSIPLAGLGFTVTAIDLSATLLRELERRRGQLPIRTIQADLLDLQRHISPPLELVVCMGDTLTHLPDFESVEWLLAAVHAQLEVGGRLILSFRNLTPELPRAKRFIPVRSDDERVFSCFLEYEGDYAIVHDILYTRGPNGWELKTGHYRKLRIPPEWVMGRLQSAGFRTATLKEENGLAVITAAK